MLPPPFGSRSLDRPTCFSRPSQPISPPSRRLVPLPHAQQQTRRSLSRSSQSPPSSPLFSSATLHRVLPPLVPCFRQASPSSGPARLSFYPQDRPRSPPLRSARSKANSPYIALLCPASLLLSVDRRPSRAHRPSRRPFPSGNQQQLASRRRVERKKRFSYMSSAPSPSAALPASSSRHTFYSNRSRKRASTVFSPRSAGVVDDVFHDNSSARASCSTSNLAAVSFPSSAASFRSAPSSSSRAGALSLSTTRSGGVAKRSSPRPIDALRKAVAAVAPAKAAVQTAALGSAGTVDTSRYRLLFEDEYQDEVVEHMHHMEVGPRSELLSHRRLLADSQAISCSASRCPTLSGWSSSPNSSPT